MTMPTFEPVAMRRIVLNRANKLATNSNFYIDGFEAYKMGNLVQAIFETIESQLQQAYEAGLRDAVPEGWKLIETAPKDCGFLGYQKITPDLWVIVPMYWSGSEYLIIQFHSDNTEHPMKPTRWKPLPAPPKGD